jgi:hypothetical protein
MRNRTVRRGQAVGQINLVAEGRAIRRLWRSALMHQKRAVQEAVEVGRRLVKVKASRKITHGKWLAWLRKHCPEISEDTAERLMRLPRLFDQNSARVRNLEGLSLSILYVLAAKNTPPELVGEVVRRTEAGETITRKHLVVPVTIVERTSTVPYYTPKQLPGSMPIVRHSRHGSATWIRQIRSRQRQPNPNRSPNHTTTL